MIAAAVLSSLVLLQDPSSLEAYQPPRIRPFEPPSDFAINAERQPVEGDGRVFVRRPIDRSFSVEEYAGQYEATPSEAELAYAQGVAAAELQVDGAMGPLDGLWRVVGAEGEVILTLALADAGGSTPVQGAWLDEDAPPAADGGPLGSIVRTGTTARIEAGAWVLTLDWAEGGWRGRLSGPGGERSVSLRRP
ncbi:hypothetical protein [Brevundimonas balnearis]|uniref:Uncharacterized protein n=1 Tax=Brevundimonas balnearis TaxID=1572858 RepID=A0ABV6R2H2_9CAUL